MVFKHAIKIENTETDIAIIKLFFILATVRRRRAAYEEDRGRSKKTCRKNKQIVIKSLYGSLNIFGRKRKC